MLARAYLCLYSGCQKNVPVFKRFFLQPLMPHFLISELYYGKRYKSSYRPLRHRSLGLFKAIRLHTYTTIMPILPFFKILLFSATYKFTNISSRQNVTNVVKKYVKKLSVGCLGIGRGPHINARSGLKLFFKF